MNRCLHIICFEAPLPANYSKAIDILNRIKAFHKAGIDIYLHYFTDQKNNLLHGLNNFCKKIYHYKLSSSALKTTDFVAYSTKNGLLNNLLADGHPMLFEGHQTTGILNNIDITNRRICVRLQGGEINRYKNLADIAVNPIKKIYYYTKRSSIESFYKKLPAGVLFACSSQNENESLSKIGIINSYYIPTFTNWQNVNCPEGVGNLCLFHGNLSKAENEKAALWLLCNVFNKVRVPFVIAGKDPSKRLQKAAGLCQHTCLVSNPTDEELDDLITKAHINVLPDLCKNETGIKLKLLHALYKGRHCVVNPKMIEGTGLEAACHIGKNANAIASIVSQLYYQPFNEEEIILRKDLLYNKYDNDSNIKQFISLLW